VTALDCKLFGRLIPIYFFGDSHALPFRDVAVTANGTGETYIVKSHYINGFSTSKLKGAGKIPAAIEAALGAFELLDRDSKPSWQSTTARSINEQFSIGHPMHPPVLVMSCGDIDMRSRIFKQFGEEFSVAGTTHAGNGARGKQLTVAAVEKMISDQLAPAVSALASLSDAGFPQSHLAMLMPPSMPDAEFEAMHGYRCPLAVRARLVQIANAVLRRICAEAKVGFADYSPAIAEADGILKKELYLDGIHVAADAAPHFCSAVLAQTFERKPSRQINSGLYRLSEKQGGTTASDAAQKFGREAEIFKRDGICTVAIPDRCLSAIADGLDFINDVGNRHLNRDWSGNAADAFSPNLKAATPTEKHLRAVYDMFYSECYAGLFQAALGRDVYFVNCRPLQSIAHAAEGSGPQKFHRDGCPPGLYRALIYLTDVNENTGAFEYQDGQGNSVKVTGKAGTLVFFDANKLLHRGSPPREGYRRVIDLCVQVRPERMTRRVMWAGMNNWPKDPFNYSVRDMRAWPPFDTERIALHPIPPGLTSEETGALVGGAQKPSKPLGGLKLPLIGKHLLRLTGRSRRTA
jgi:hypothetical protein